MATTERASSGGVKSLRAVFENPNASGDTDPSRGRASSSADTGHSGDDTPRPLSKVRTAFVPVEGDTPKSNKKDKRPGISRIDSLKSTGTSDRDPKSGKRNAQDDRELPVEEVYKKATSIATTSIPDSQQEFPANSRTNELIEGDKNFEVPTVKMSLAQSKSETLSEPKSKASRRPDSIRVEKTRMGVQPPISGQNTSIHPQTPIGHRPKVSAVKTESPNVTTRRIQRNSIDTSYTVPSFARATNSNASKAKPTLNGATPAKLSRPRQTTEGFRSATGFVKPRPKSPTRPIALPAHLVAPTASSAAKRAETPLVQPPSKVSQNRRMSTFSVASSGPSTANPYDASLSASLSRKPSATFGPPPRRKAQATSPSTTVRPPDSFLQRMMRPTASSASKVRDGVEDAKSPQRLRVASRMGGTRVASAMENPVKMRSVQNLRGSNLKPKRDDNSSIPIKRNDEKKTEMTSEKAIVAHKTASETSTADKIASSTATLAPEEEKAHVDEVEEVVVAKDENVLALEPVQEVA